MAISKFHILVLIGIVSLFNLTGVTLHAHPDVGAHAELAENAVQPTEPQKEELRYYFDLFTFLINQTITPLQQAMVDQANTNYLEMVPWADGGDADQLIADSSEIIDQLKSTIPGYSLDWSSEAASINSPSVLQLTYGLSSFIWLDISNSSAEIIDLKVREAGAFSAAQSVVIQSGGHRVILVSIASRASGNTAQLELSLEADGGSIVRQVSVPVELSEGAVITGTILEEATGESFPGRVYVVGSDGIGRVGEAYKNNSTLSNKIIFEIASENKFGTWNLPFFYSDGSFEVIVPKGDVQITLERGYEHNIVSQTHTLSAGETKSVTLSSGRFMDMKSLGWISGDTHIHWVKNWWSENEDINLLAMAQRAEDLRVANNLTLYQYRPEDQGGEFIAPSQFPMGPVTSLSDSEYHIQMAEEYRNDHFYGHLCFLNITSLIQPIATGQGSGGPAGQEDWPLNKTAIEEVHRQGGISTEAHNLGPSGRSDVPVNAIMGLADAFDQMEPVHYYRFLDCGLQIPLGNGSDHPARTIGSARMYVKVDGGFTYENWIEGIRQGRTFTSSGPLVFLTVNDREIGDELQVSAGDTLDVVARVYSRHPIGNFQVVSNGVVVAETTTSETQATLDFQMTADVGRWFVARSSPSNNYSALSRPNISHTSGIYVKVDGKGPFNAEAAEYWISLLNAHKDNVDQNATYEHAWQEAEQLAYIDSGIKAYETLVEESNTVPSYYVSSSAGNDNNTGLSPDQAWASFANFDGLNLEPGTSIYLRRGDIWVNSQLVLSGKGEPGNPITLSAYGEGRPPIITGINLTTEACVVWNNPSHVRIDSLHCKDAKIGIYLRFTGGNIDGTGEMFNNQDVHITNCYFENMDEKWSDETGSIFVQPPYEISWGAGIWLGGSIPAPPGGPYPSEQSLILNDFSVTHCGFRNVDTGLGNGFYHPHVYRSRFTNLRFEDSWVTGCVNGAFALFFVDGGHAKRIDTWVGGSNFYATGTTGGFIQSSRNFLVEDCQFAGNIRPSLSNDGVGFDIEGDCESITVRDCVIHDNDGAGILVLNTGGYNNDLILENLTLWNNDRNPYPGSRKQNSEMRYAGRPSPPDPSSYGQLTNVGIYLGTDEGIGDAAGYLTAFDIEEDWWDDYSPVNVRSSNSWDSVRFRPQKWFFDQGIESWGNPNQLNDYGWFDGMLTGTSTGPDPYVESPLTWVNARETRWMKVRMSSTAGMTAQVFFQTETEPFYTGDKMLVFELIPDGQLRDYWIDLGSSPEYRGVITRWRLDPSLETGAEIRVDSVEVKNSPYILSLEAISPNHIDMRFNQAMLNGGGVFLPTNYRISGLGADNLSPNPDSVSLHSTTTGPVYRLNWNNGSMNGLPVEVEVVNAVDPRGVAVAIGSTVGIDSLPLVYSDRDNDTLPDFWEDANGLNSDNSSDASLDFDLDGFSNRDEYLANTDPQDPLSRLQILDFYPTTMDQIDLTWASSSGMAYRLEASDDLQQWTNITSDLISTSGAQTTAEISFSDTPLFLRVIPQRPSPLLSQP